MPNEQSVNGRDERNLLEFPIGVSGKSQPVDENGQIAKEIVRRVEVFDEDIGECVPKQLTIRTSSKHAFITGYDIEVLMGLFALHHQKDNFASSRIEFENGELYKLMRWPKGSGANNERLQVALDRFAGVQLTFENSFSSDGGKTTRKTYSTGVLDSYQFTKTSDVADEGRSWIRWSGELFVGFKQGNIKPLNTQAFFSLNRPVSQQAYRLLDDAFQRNSEFEMDLMEFAMRVGVNSQKTGVIKQRLQPVIVELESLPGFVEKASPAQRYSKQGAGRWKIHFTRSKLKNDQSKQPTTSPTNPKNSSSAAEQFVREFYQLWRGEVVHKVYAGERKLAEHLLENYEYDELRAAAPAVVKELKLWKEARTFGATSRLWHQCVKKTNRKVKPPSPVARTNGDQQQKLSQERIDWRKLPFHERMPFIEQVHRTTTVDFVRSQIAKKKYDDPLVEGECITLWSKRKTDHHS